MRAWVPVPLAMGQSDGDAEALCYARRQDGTTCKYHGLLRGDTVT